MALGRSYNEQVLERNWKSTPPGRKSLWGGGNWNPADQGVPEIPGHRLREASLRHAGAKQ